MTSTEFLGALESQLCTLTPEERESALTYYREYLEEAGTEEAAAIRALGSPQSVAERIIREVDENRVAYAGNSRMNYQYAAAETPPSPSDDHAARIALTILVIILTFPIWITVFSLWFAVVVTLASFLLAFAFSVIAAPLQGIILIAGDYVGEGLWTIGAGIVMLGLTLLLWKPIQLGIKYSTIGLFRLCKLCISGLLGRRNQK